MLHHHNRRCKYTAIGAGAETGAGGRIRDTHATGTGSIMGASTAGYCVGNLQLDSFRQSWEDSSAVYPANLASPLQILIDASNGASDYGNKFGEPLIGGYMGSFGMRVPDGSRREWIKPIMFRQVALVAPHAGLLYRVVRQIQPHHCSEGQSQHRSTRGLIASL